MGHDGLVGNKVGPLVSLAGYKIGNWLADGVGPLTQMVPIRPSSPFPAGHCGQARDLVSRGGVETHVGGPNLLRCAGFRCASISCTEDCDSLT